MLEMFKHENIIGFKEQFMKEEDFCIVMDFADDGDLDMKVCQQQELEPRQYFSELQVLKWFTQICRGMKCVHDLNVIHRDIKCKNVFVTKEGKIKIGDFGIAEFLKKFESMEDTAGTLSYMSPERCLGEPYSFKSDIWSMGVMFYEICALERPFKSTYHWQNERT